TLQFQSLAKTVTLYRSNTLKQTFGMEIANESMYAGRDPLAEIIEEAHKRNIAVIPWFESGFALQRGNQILQKKPAWAARDREGKVLVKNGYEWMNALNPEVQDFMSAIVMEVVKNYNVDGIQGSDRMPAMPIEGGYDSLTQAAYADVHGTTTPPLDFRDMHWKYWRAVRLNSFARSLYWKVKALKHTAIVSWGVDTYPLALDENLQDWRSWVTLGVNGDNYADWVNPQIKSTSSEEYKLVLDSQNKELIKVNNPARCIFPTIILSNGDQNISAEGLKEVLRYNRYSGYNGEVISSYAELQRDNGKLAKALLDSYYKTPARLPFKAAFQK
ncbi:MAG: family 10 glycosylhydrolase, partial [bacterium]